MTQVEFVLVTADAHGGEWPRPDSFPLRSTFPMEGKLSSEGLLAAKHCVWRTGRHQVEHFDKCPSCREKSFQRVMESKRASLVPDKESGNTSCAKLTKPGAGRSMSCRILSLNGASKHLRPTTTHSELQVPLGAHQSVRVNPRVPSRWREHTGHYSPCCKMSINCSSPREQF